jgi:FixJ family two-component response regulator
MSDARPYVVVIDDDPSIRESLKGLFKTVALDVDLFASTDEFLASERDDGPCCIVLDIRLQGLSGLDFQRELAGGGIRTPIIFITAYGDIPMSVQAMKAGAVEFLTKPFRNQELLDAVRVALDQDRRRRQDDQLVGDLQKRFRSLTPREQQVMSMVTTGLVCKQVAAELGVSEMTVRIHRAQVMKKMEARSLAALVRTADKLGLRETERRGS